MAWVAIALITLLQQLASVGEKVRGIGSMDNPKN